IFESEIKINISFLIKRKKFNPIFSFFCLMIYIWRQIKFSLTLLFVQQKNKCMKKTSLFGIVGIILLVLFVSGQQYVQSVPESLPEHDSLLISSVSQPIDIENILA